MNARLIVPSERSASSIMLTSGGETVDHGGKRRHRDRNSATAATQGVSCRTHRRAPGATAQAPFRVKNGRQMVFSADERFPGAGGRASAGEALQDRIRPVDETLPFLRS